MRFVLLFTFIASSILAAGLPTKKISAGSRGSSKRLFGDFIDLKSSLEANNDSYLPRAWRGGPHSQVHYWGRLPKRVRPPKQTSFEQYISPGTFVDQTGKTTSGPHAYDEYQSGVTVTIGLATGLTLNGKITYDGSYQPLVVPDVAGPAWVYFTLIGVFVECTVDDPCFGYIARGRGYKHVAQTGRVECAGRYTKSYVGISKGPKGYNKFKGFKGKPEVIPNQKDWEKEIARRMGTEWEAISDEVNKRFMLMTIPAILNS